MGEWNLEHRAFIVETYFKNQESYATTIRKFRLQFKLAPCKPVPSRNTVLSWVKNLREKGTLNKTKPPGPSCTVRTPENVSRVREAFETSPSRSMRQHASSLNISRTSIHRILHQDLNFHPYKMLMTQQLLDMDHTLRLGFCTRILKEIEEKTVPLQQILFTDEAHFYLHGDVNSQNMRYWSVNNPHIIHEKPLHSPRLTVWVGVASFGIIGPYFFKETVNGVRYREMLDNFVIPELRRKKKLKTTWFQQDGATCHTATETLELLRTYFGNRIISRGCDIIWPSRSPDLNCLDYFLWGYLKSRVYVNKPRTLLQLQANIEHEIAEISVNLTRRVIENFKRRAEVCIQNKGGHLNDVIFKTN